MFSPALVQIWEVIFHPWPVRARVKVRKTCRLVGLAPDRRLFAQRFHDIGGVTGDVDIARRAYGHFYLAVPGLLIHLAGAGHIGVKGVRPRPAERRELVDENAIGRILITQFAHVAGLRGAQRGIDGRQDGRIAVGALSRKGGRRQEHGGHRDNKREAMAGHGSVLLGVSAEETELQPESQMSSV